MFENEAITEKDEILSSNSYNSRSYSVFCESIIGWSELEQLCNEKVY